ncbi:MAG: UUP1 family membrane protein [Deltaproteobacteria bacterium]|nr:UUP1 family membrane protein [Deltaproteobacteria bacterium]
MTYRIVGLGYPVFPTAPGQTWQLQINALVTPLEKECVLSLALPLDRPGNLIIEENVFSGPYHFSLQREESNRAGIWTGSDITGPEPITYRAIILYRPNRLVRKEAPGIGSYPLSIKKEEQALLEKLTARWTRLSPIARLSAVSEALQGRWGGSIPGEEELRPWHDLQNKHDRTDLILAILTAAGLPARSVQGVRLTEGVQTGLTQWIEIWTGKKWEALKSETGELYKTPVPLLPLVVGTFPPVRTTGGDLTDIRWMMSRQVVSQWKLHYEDIIRSDRILNRWSLFRLPEEFQQTFRILLLVPIGALLIGLLRNVVGFPTFGIFMPVLMALAFRNTGLVYGMSIFGGVLFFGYLARRFLDRIHLLLVPRMAVLLSLVICSFTILALLGNQYGLRQFMAVGLLPFVILTMIIERFFILIEESGLKEALLTSAGSAAVSVITYQIISWEPLQLSFFVYPELILWVAALQILLGRYTGYRLSELIRFRNFRERV